MPVSSFSSENPRSREIFQRSDQCLRQSFPARRRDHIHAFQFAISRMKLQRAAADGNSVFARHQEDDVGADMFLDGDAKTLLRRIERGEFRVAALKQRDRFG